MANQFTDSTLWTDLVETAYDRQIAYALRAMPQWRQVIDKHPAQQAMPGDVVVLTIHKEFANLATTPLSESVDPDSVAPQAPRRIPVTLNEYGNVAISTLRLNTLSFSNPKPDASLAELMGRNRIDTMDSLVRTVVDGSTNVLYVNAGVMKTTTGSIDSIVATDKLLRDPATAAVKLLQRANTMPKASGLYVAMIDPDVAFDLQGENSATAWTAPHTYGGDTAAIYSGSIGDFQGARYVQTTRITHTTNAGSVKVYNTTYLAREAVVEANAIEPHTVLGPQTDSLRRFQPIGWYGLLGWSIYRPEAIVKVQTSSSLGALTFA